MTAPYDFETCRAMMDKYAGWYFSAVLAGDCYAEFYRCESNMWNKRMKAAGGVP